MNTYKKVVYILGAVIIIFVSFKVGNMFYNYQVTSEEQAISLSQGNSTNKSKSKSNILLVNRSNNLSENYVPNNLVIPNIKFLSTSLNRNLDSEASEKLESMFNDAKKQGVVLLGVSGYREYKYQESLYNKKVKSSSVEEADRYVAKAGESEHQTGLAIDILSKEYTKLDEGFAQTKAYKWIVNNCSKYGFIVRYPKGKEDITGYDFEPWHIRYVGENAANTIMKEKITLEEYLSK